MKTRTLIHLGLLLAIALAIQSLHLPTFITGPVINAVLIVAVVFPGVLGSIVIGCITPLAAWVLGIINPIAAPVIPVIVAANATLGIIFYLLRERNNYLAVIGAALGKYFVFYVSLNFLFGIFNIRFPAPMLAAFQIPQLLTALVGGIVGLGIIKQLEKIYKLPQEDEQTAEVDLKVPEDNMLNKNTR